MNACKGFSKMWFLALLLITVVAGCGGSDSVAPNSNKAITDYSVAGATGTVDESTKTIAVTVPYETRKTDLVLVATFTTTGSGVKVGTVAQKSATTPNDFINPVKYTVTATDNSKVDYTVTVTVAPFSAKGISRYSINGVAGVISDTNKTISVTMPKETKVTALVATFTTSGKVVTVGTTVQKSAVTSNNFTNPVVYTVTAADTTAVNYTVKVNVPVNSDKAITAYSLKGVAGIIVDTSTPKTITVTVPNGTDLSNLRATFTTTGSSVTVGTPAVVQQPGTTPNDFRSPVVTYTVNAADNSSVTYNVSVIVSANKGPMPVELGTAGNFVILAKTGVSTTGTTKVTGNIGLSPAAATFLTGFSPSADPSNVFSTSSYVTGRLYASDYAVPTPANMTTAISDMEKAFTDAAGRTLPDFTELYAGDITGKTLVPGLYKWGTGLLISGGGVTISGGANDVWIFQIAQDLTVSNSAIVTLSGGAQARNIFWQVSGQATLGTAADFQGIILSQTLISFNTGAKMTGRALAQTAVTLDAATITAP